MEATTVEILESSLVVPSEDTPRETLRLSNIDIMCGRHLICTLYLYKNNHGGDANNFFSAELLKSSLAKALVLFYPLAGRQVVGHHQVVCNAEGVPFVEARLDRSADSIQFEPMSPELIEFFIPKEHSSSLLMLQVTYLKCGSVVLGTSMSHILIDGQSASDFYQTWSRIVRGGDVKNIVTPSFDNSPLRARSPPKISFDFPLFTTDEQIKRYDDPDSCVLSVLRLSKEQIRRLKNRCSEGRKETSTVSTFCAVSALVWKCYCIAKGLPPDSQSRLCFPANLRSHLSPPLTAYFGNAVTRLCATSQVSKIISNPMGYVASTVKAAIDELSDEYIRSLIDYLEVNMNKFSFRETSESRIRTIPMASCDVDFGWGSPQLYSWERLTQSRVIYIVGEPGKDGCIKVVAALDSSTIQRFKKVFYEELLVGCSLL